MRKIFLSIFLFLHYSVAISQNSENSNQIVFIFGGYIKGNSVAESGIYYSKTNDFRADFVYPKNTNDTVLVNEIESKMILTHVFDLGLNYIYEFQKGDTVKFDYKNGRPRVSLLNKRTVLKNDFNFEDDFKSIKRPFEPNVFSLEN